MVQFHNKVPVEIFYYKYALLLPSHLRLRNRRFWRQEDTRPPSLPAARCNTGARAQLLPPLMNGRPFAVGWQNLLKHVLDQALHFPFGLPPQVTLLASYQKEIPCQWKWSYIKAENTIEASTLSFNLMNVEDIVDSMDVEESVDYMNI